MSWTEWSLWNKNNLDSLSCHKWIMVLLCLHTVSDPTPLNIYGSYLPAFNFLYSNTFTTSLQCFIGEGKRIQIIGANCDSLKQASRWSKSPFILLMKSLSSDPMSSRSLFWQPPAERKQTEWSPETSHRPRERGHAGHPNISLSIFRLYLNRGVIRAAFTSW